MNSKALQVWLVDDDASIRWVLEKALEGQRHRQHAVSIRPTTR